MADVDSPAEAEPTGEGADVLDRLDPVILHHIVNTLGWPDLRPLQRAAITPLMDGEDAVLLAPTAGGKTEAACFPCCRPWPSRSGPAPRCCTCVR